MSVNFRIPNLEASANPVVLEEIRIPREDQWVPEQFAREQVRGLVRQIFFSSVAQPVRQVVFTTVEARTQIAQLCRQVGESLAQETKGNVAVLTRELPGLESRGHDEAHSTSAIAEDSTAPRDGGRRVTNNLWLLTQLPESGGRIPASYARLCQLRTEFDYSIIQGPPAAPLSEVAALGQLADGLVLVLTAHKTRRAAAKKIKENLEAARTKILGTVLCDRTFPIPDALYRRL